MAGLISAIVQGPTATCFWVAGVAFVVHAGLKIGRARLCPTLTILRDPRRRI